jgi:ubiquinone/menaquinone biosynthesis C-methylase UbiE
MIDSYEKLNAAEGYLDSPDPFTLERYRQFFNYFPDQRRIVLDVGCNTGRGGATLKQLNKNLQLIGLDCNQTLLDNISNGIYEQKICSSSTTNISLESSSVDIVVAGEFIEHLYPDDVLQTLREFHRLIKPGGRLLLTTPNPGYLLLKLIGKSVIGGAHVSEHYPKKLKKELENIGFINIKILGSGKMFRLLGDRFPLLMLYGSYLAIANKI